MKRLALLACALFVWGCSETTAPEVPLPALDVYPEADNCLDQDMDVAAAWCTNHAAAVGWILSRDDVQDCDILPYSNPVYPYYSVVVTCAPIP